MKKNLYNSISFALVAISLVFLISSCSTYNQEDFEEEIVIEAYIVAGRTLPKVRVSTTVPVFDVYNFDDTAISDATVIIQELGENGVVVQEFAYELRSAGMYEAVNQSYKAKEQRQYRLQVQTSMGTASSTTTVPKQFESTPPTTTTVVYQGSEQFEVAVTATSTAERQTSFIFSVIAQDTSIANLTPFYASVFEDDEENTLADFRLVSSPIINEANYELQEDGTILIRLPWISIAFYGPNQIIASSLDDNLFDFIRSQSVQLGGGALAPGEIQNIINRVDGGIGVFGSMSTDTNMVTIVPPTLPLKEIN